MESFSLCALRHIPAVLICNLKFLNISPLRNTLFLTRKKFTAKNGSLYKADIAEAKATGKILLNNDKSSAMLCGTHHLIWQGILDNLSMNDEKEEAEEM